MIDIAITYVPQAMQYASPKGLWNALFASNNIVSSQSQGNLICTDPMHMFLLCWIDKSSLIKV